MTNKWAEMPDEEFKKMMAEGKQRRYELFVSQLLSKARGVCPTVMGKDVKTAYRLFRVIRGMYEWKEATEFFERFEAEIE